MIGRRGLLALGAATAAMTAAAALLQYGRPAPSTVRRGEPALPELVARMEEVGRLSVSGGGSAVTIDRRPEGGWGLSDRGLYPVREAAVRAALAHLAELRLVEPRTARPELYPRIGVEDPAAEGAQSLLVELHDLDGAPLARMIVGHERQGGFGALGPARYVRRPGEAQAWLAGGALALARDPIDWVDRALLDIPPDRIAMVAIEGPGRPALRVARDPAPGTGFHIEDAPEGRTVDRQFRVDNLATTLEGLELNDLRPADELIVPEDGPRAAFTTTDGLVVTGRLIDDPAGGAPWLILEAAAASEDAIDEAEALTARLAGWAYRVPKFKADRFATRIEDITKPSG